MRIGESRERTKSHFNAEKGYTRTKKDLCANCRYDCMITCFLGLLLREGIAGLCWTGRPVILFPYSFYTNNVNHVRAQLVPPVDKVSPRFGGKRMTCKKLRLNISETFVHKAEHCAKLIFATKVPNH